MATEWLFPTVPEHEERRETSQHEELFVFGYACKLFRDDERAKLVDKGKYLIPWNGDENLKIDRSVFTPARRGLLSIVIKGSNLANSIVLIYIFSPYRLQVRYWLVIFVIEQRLPRPVSAAMKNEWPPLILGAEHGSPQKSVSS